MLSLLKKLTGQKFADQKAPQPETQRGQRIFKAMTDTGIISFNTPTPHLKMAILMVTNECPVGCAHCVTHSGGKLRGDTPREVIHATLRDALEIPDLKEVLLQGGDPFAAPALLKEALQLVREKGLKPLVTTSAFFAKDDETTERILGDVAGLFEELNFSIDVFHQRTVPIEYVSRSIRIAQRLGFKVAVFNCLTKDEMEAGLDISVDAQNLTREFNVQIQAWPMLRTGRGNRPSKFAPDLNPDQSCGLINRPLILPTGEVHACCSGAGFFDEKHPLHHGWIQKKTLGQIGEEMSTSLFEQGIRAFGPVRMLQLAEEKSDYTGDQCTACAALCTLPKIKDRLETVMAHRPDMIAKITEYRRAAGDRVPDAHEATAAAIRNQPVNA